MLDIIDIVFRFAIVLLVSKEIFELFYGDHEALPIVILSWAFDLTRLAVAFQNNLKIFRVGVSDESQRK